MNRNNTWRLAFVIFAVVWSLIEIYPLKDRNLIDYFSERAVRPDATFSNIVAEARSLEVTNSTRTYGNLREAIGTNDIARYFPFFEVKNELQPTQFILNKLQREARGSIKLGLDLQGGTSYVVEMDTNRLETAQSDTNAPSAPQDLSQALAQAVEVLRKRVDRFGVAEPLIQPEGEDRIRIELPRRRKASRNRFKRRRSWNSAWFIPRASNTSIPARARCCRAWCRRATR
jgi:hypothetical protein